MAKFTVILLSMAGGIEPVASKFEIGTADSDPKATAVVTKALKSLHLWKSKFRNPLAVILSGEHEAKIAKDLDALQTNPDVIASLKVGSDFPKFSLEVIEIIMTRTFSAEDELFGNATKDKVSLKLAEAFGHKSEYITLAVAKARVKGVATAIRDTRRYAKPLQEEVYNKTVSPEVAAWAKKQRELSAAERERKQLLLKAMTK